MKVTAKINKEFPALAWISNISGERIEIIHGDHVEMTENFGLKEHGAVNSTKVCLQMLNGFVVRGGNKIKRSNLFYT